MPRALDRNAFHDASRQLADVYGLQVAHTPSPFASRQWRHRGTKAMPESGNEFGEVGRNIADYCYTRHPRHTAKKVANEIGCELDTAKKWLRGQVPGTKHLFRMIQAWGPDFWACMLEPLDAAEARRVKLDNELKRLEQELGALKKEINTQPKD